MNYKFVLGVGRSGTSLLGRLVSLSSSNIRYLIEPIPSPNIIHRYNRAEPWAVLPYPEEILNLTSLIAALSTPDDHNLLIKEVHALLAFPMALDAFEHKTVVITRDVTRVVDSYLFGHGNDRTYLVDECQYLNLHTDDREIFRLAATIARINQTLIKWANSQDEVTHITFEKLCADPVAEMINLYKYLKLSYDQETIREITSITQTTSLPGYYDTQKNSLKILGQEYKYLDKKTITELKEFLT